MTLYPTAADLAMEPMELEKNITLGKYLGGIEHYLDVHFRLLREDYIRPLRDTLMKYRSGKDVTVYTNVQIRIGYLTTSGQRYCCKFNVEPFINTATDWNRNKLLTTGALLCVSADNFETTFFATVSGFRKPEDLERGNFQIVFLTTDLPEIRNNEFSMMEAPVMFDAYRYNLQKLQNFDNKFPLERYIISTEKKISPPAYLYGQITTGAAKYSHVLGN